MKIIIAGGGIAGLSAYLHLRKHLPTPPSPHPPHTIRIYESHRPGAAAASTTPDATPTPTPLNPSFEALSASTAVVGGGLGVAPNGMRVLAHLDRALHDAVSAQGFPCDKFVFMGRNGWTLGVQETNDRGGFDGEGKGEVCVSSSRHGLWACLRGAVPPEGVVRYQKVVGAKRRGDGRIVVALDDGGEDECDLLVGADGVKSVVRRALFGEGEGAPVYTGTSGVGGFIKMPLPDRVVDNKAMVFTFGPNGFFGYASGAPVEADNLMWWSTFETDALSSRETLEIAEIKAELQKRHAHWADPVVRDIVSRAEVESIYPTWVMPDLPHWGEDGIVLIGDAAHALSPTTGQGASQALEDSQTLSLLLAETLKTEYAASSSHESLEIGERNAIAVAVKQLYNIRKPRIKEIADRGRKLDGGKKNMGVLAEYSMYWFLWLMMRLPFLGKLAIGDVYTQLYGWSAKREVEKALREEIPPS
ncbi:hypothetical protein OQA88_2292 [Cercophora sp. LCS_1]